MRKVESRDGSVEIKPGRGGEPLDVPPARSEIEVGLEDRVLREAEVQVERARYLGELSRDGPGLDSVLEPRELHRDRGRAHATVLLYVGFPARARECRGVYPRVSVEIAVFLEEDRGDEGRGKVGEPFPDPVFLVRGQEDAKEGTVVREVRAGKIDA